MGSQALQFLRQGLWASLTGGWCFDPHQSKFSNAFHLYVWLFLLCFPFTLYLVLPPNMVSVGIYCGVIAIFFTSLKSVNYRLHMMFDRGELVERSGCSGGGGVGGSGGVGGGGIEMLDLRSREGTPPLACSSRNSCAGDLHRVEILPVPESTGSAKVLKRNVFAASCDRSVCTSEQRLTVSARGMKTPTDALGREKPPLPPLLSCDSPASSHGSGSLDSETQTLLASVGKRPRVTSGDAPATASSSAAAVDGGRPTWSSEASEAPARRRNGQAPRASLSEFLDMPALRAFESPDGREPGSLRGDAASVSVDDSPGNAPDDDDEDGGGSGGVDGPRLPDGARLRQEESRNSLRSLSSVGSGRLRFVEAADDPRGSRCAAASEDDRGKSARSQPPDPRADEKSSARADARTKQKERLPSYGGETNANPHSNLIAADALAAQKAADVKEGNGGRTRGGRTGAENPSRRPPSHSVSHPPRRTPSMASAKTHARVLSMDAGGAAAAGGGRAIMEIPAPPSADDVAREQSQTPPSEWRDLVTRSHSDWLELEEQGAAGGVPSSVSEEGGKPRRHSSMTRGAVRRQTVRRRHHAGSNPTPPPSILGSPLRTVPAAARHRCSSPCRACRSPWGRPCRAAVAQLPGAPPLHVATSHDDTTSGAVHCFEDEDGNLMTYTFGEQSDGCATLLSNMDATINPKHSSCSHRDSHSYFDAPSVGFLDKTEEAASRDRDLNPYETIEVPRPRESVFLEQVRAKSLHRYKLQFFPGAWLAIRYDRLALLALLDRNRQLGENILAVVLAVLVAFLGFVLLKTGFFHDIWVLQFCLVIASCQYSLIKSVQPDAASPMHGHNRVIAYSRPAYFCLCCGLMWLLDLGSQSLSLRVAFTLYGVPCTVPRLLIFARDLIMVFTLCFPVVFVFGLLPQINTFLMYVLEQLDMHVFGGNAATSVLASVYGFVRSVLCVALLYGFCYGALTQTWDSQHIPVLFSVFCGLLVALSYHLSRQNSDPTVLWSLIQSKLLPEEPADNPEEPLQEMKDPLPDKLKQSVSERLQSDVIVCVVMAVLAFAVHVSTVFVALQPVLSLVLYGLTGGVGILVHYVLPQLRKQLPWYCFAHPLLKTREYSQFEVREPAQLMWFEKSQVWLQFLEKNFLYPAVVLSAMTNDAKTIASPDRLGPYVGALAVVVAGMKLLRFSFSSPTYQYVTLIFTVLFFRFDYPAYSETFLLDFFFFSIVFSKLWDLWHKLRFVFTYIAPWQITWGSAFHAFAQPFAVP
uniref:Pecanex-like protein n=1 Tax=Petromyzon marinus TaxID=7757 RepID=S4RU74_PETMA